MNKRPNFVPRPSKIPIAISRRVRNDVTQDETRPTSRLSTTTHVCSVKKSDRFKRNCDKHYPHRQLGRRKVNVPPRQSRAEIVSSRASTKSRTEIVLSTESIVPSTITRKSAMIKSQQQLPDMVRFQELCDQIKRNGHHRRPLLLINKPANKTMTSDEVINEDDFKQLVKKAAYSQRRRRVMLRSTPVSPGYTRVMQEASETMLRSVNRLYTSRKHSTAASYQHQLNDVRTNLADQLDCCKVADTSTHHDNRRRTVVLQQGGRGSLVDCDSTTNY